MEAAALMDSSVYRADALMAQQSVTTPRPVVTPVPRLNRFVRQLQFRHQLTEWGTPSGSIAQVLPALVAQAMGEECLWVSDKEQNKIYPNSWSGLGFNLNSLYFLNESKPLQSIRTVLCENTFPFVIIDIRQRLNSADLHFLHTAVKQKKITIFLLRPFYLSNKNGNPFSKQRINSSYSISRKSFQLSVVKGRAAQKINLSFQEVLCG